MSSLFRTKSIDELIAASEGEFRLRRHLGLWSLVAFGIGSVIGSGIFTFTGTAAAGLKFDFHSILKAPVLDLLLIGKDAASTGGRPGAGPAISLSFVLVALVCGFAALCYAELASMIPVAGSAYTYAYATLGEIFAWIIGWDLILEYAVSNMAVAVGFGAYMNDLMDNAFGFHLPMVLSNPVFVEGKATGAWFNVPSFLLLMALSWILVRGVRESAQANNAMVIIKVVAILLFIFGAARAVNTANWHPFMPNGFSGVLTGGAIVFFTYIGFDSVSTAAEECSRPQRDMPLGILLTLVACAVLYAGVALVLTGIAHWDTLNNDAPVANALKALGYNRLRLVVTVGALLGMISSLLVFQYGQARIWFAMSRDRLLPGVFSHVHPRFKTPDTSTWIAGFVVGIPAGIWDIGTFGDLTNIGTLFAFIIVSVGVIVLRRSQPERPRSFRVPWVPVLPMLSIFSCLVLMLSLPLETWIRFVVWLVIGLVIYFYTAAGELRLVLCFNLHSLQRPPHGNLGLLFSTECKRGVQLPREGHSFMPFILLMGSVSILSAQEPQNSVPANVPLTLGQKYLLTADQVAGPGALFAVGIHGLLDDALNRPHQWGSDEGSVGLRIASDFGRRFLRQNIAFGVRALDHEDPRYFRSGHGSVLSRVRYAAIHTFVVRNDNGSSMPAYSLFVSASTMPFIAQSWRPESFSAARGVGGASSCIGIAVATNIWNEFWPGLRAKLPRKLGGGVRTSWFTQTPSH